MRYRSKIILATAAAILLTSASLLQAWSQPVMHPAAIIHTKCDARIANCTTTKVACFPDNYRECAQRCGLFDDDPPRRRACIIDCKQRWGCG